MKLRFVSWNVHKARGRDGRRDTSRVLGVIASLAPDVAVLQEADYRFGRRGGMLFEPEEIEKVTGLVPHPPVQSAGRLGWHGNLLIARPGIELVHAKPLDLPSLEPRGAVVWRLSYRGTEFDVVGMHLGLVGFWRHLQVAALASEIASREEVPTVVAGDTNVWRRKSPTMAPVESLLDGPQPHVNTFPARRPAFPLDRILAGRGASLHSIRAACDGMASDHSPLVSTISLAGPRRP